MAGKSDADLIALRTPLAELKVDPEFSDYNQTDPEGRPKRELDPRLELDPNQQTQIGAHREVTSQLENEFLVEVKKPTVLALTHLTQACANTHSEYVYLYNTAS